MKTNPHVRLVLIAASALLTGCMNTVAYKAPQVEERSTRSSEAVVSNGVVTPVNPNSGVTVTPIAPTPVFRPQKDEFEPVTSNPVPAAPTVVKAKQNPAVVALLSTSRQQISSGQYRSAQSNLQRALRISPKDPEVYLSLADTHRRLGEFLQGEQVALKGVAVAQGQKSKLYKLWTLIEKIRSDAGDSEGAENASGIARRYQ